jgi:quercetin dioxygenase-like cupin family protein
MSSTTGNASIFRRVADGTPGQALDLLGPVAEFVTEPEPQGSFCVLRGVLPPGMTVPLHSHDDAEDFLVLTGTHQVLLQGPDGLEWADAHAGDYVHIPAGAPHAHRNTSPDPAVDLMITTARLGQFFAEAGRPVTGLPQPPAPGDVARFTAVAARYGHTLGSPEENAAVGIEMPKFADSQ